LHYADVGALLVLLVLWRQSTKGSALVLAATTATTACDWLQATVVFCQYYIDEANSWDLVVLRLTGYVHDVRTVIRYVQLGTKQVRDCHLNESHLKLGNFQRAFF
jgi:hypothetical protein